MDVATTASKMNENKKSPDDTTEPSPDMKTSTCQARLSPTVTPTRTKLSFSVESLIGKSEPNNSKEIKTDSTERSPGCRPPCLLHGSSDRLLSGGSSHHREKDVAGPRETVQSVDASSSPGLIDVTGDEDDELEEEKGEMSCPERCQQNDDPSSPETDHDIHSHVAHSSRVPLSAPSPLTPDSMDSRHVSVDLLPLRHHHGANSSLNVPRPLPLSPHFVFPPPSSLSQQGLRDVLSGFARGVGMGPRGLRMDVSEGAKDVDQNLDQEKESRLGGATSVRSEARDLPSLAWPTSVLSASGWSANHHAPAPPRE
ncbi:hypothetical protein BaRGS_00025511 [Batillaria attramentaria]|uniref:Uncharacterized protein n=1 Tax=Batillaria attramentaria TaxID=370345 RepID=A0ABD0K820_9CAEN